MKKIDIIKQAYLRYLKNTNTDYETVNLDNRINDMLYGALWDVKKYTSFLTSIQPLLHKWCHKTFEHFLIETDIQKTFYKFLNSDENDYHTHEENVITPIKNPKHFLTNSLPTRYIIDAFSWSWGNTESWGDLHKIWLIKIKEILEEEMD